MASHYDLKKMCRVGIMDEKQFYAERNEPSRSCFCDLLCAWTKAGGALKWGTGGVGLPSMLAHRGVAIGFVARVFGSKKDRIELACATLRKQLGQEKCDGLVEAVREAAGDRVGGTAMISILRPGDLPSRARISLTRALTALD